MDIVWLIVSFVISLVGLAGTVIPGIPGVPLIFIGQFIYAWATGFEVIGLAFLLFMLVLTAFGTLVDFAAGPMLARRSGASRLGAIGALVGGIVGIITFGPVGLFAGPLLGAIIGELASGQSFLKANKLGWLAFLGMWLGILVKVFVGLTMVALFTFRVL